MNLPTSLPLPTKLNSVGWWVAIATLLLAWFSLLSRISMWWNDASYYTHGWAVPLLALVLIARRSTDWAIVKRSSITPWQLISLGLLLLLPCRMIAEPDPFWRVPLWTETLSLCLVTGLFLIHSKVRIAWQAWAWTSLYFLTCLPWPAAIESNAVHSLTQWVALLTSETLLLCGYPAELLGNAIMVDRETVSINQACSGIRSLQNLISLAVFLSVYFRFDWGRFFFLLTMAGLCTLVFNFCRALCLSYVFLSQGIEVQEEWHDSIGNFFATLSMVALAAWAWLVRPRDNELSLKPDCPNPEVKGEPSKASIPWSYACAFGLPQLFSFTWFSLLSPQVPGFTWQADLGKEAQPLEQGIEDVLQFDYGEKFRLVQGTNQWVEVIHFGYNEDSAAASLCSRNHPPDYCMGYTGVELVDSNSLFPYSFGGEILKFRHYATPEKGLNGVSRLDVFWGSFTLDSRIDSYEFLPSSLWEKATWFLSGKLSYQRKVLLVTINGSKNRKDAENKLKETLGTILCSTE